jgi:hypothetical protein
MRLIFAGALVLITAAAQAQGTGSNPNCQGPYTSIGPAGAGVYRDDCGTARQREPVHRHRRHAKRDALRKRARGL